MKDVLAEMGLLFICPFHYSGKPLLTWDSLFQCATVENVGGLAFSSLNRLTWSIKEDICTEGIGDVTHTMNSAWRYFEFLCAVQETETD